MNIEEKQQFYYSDDKIYLINTLESLLETWLHNNILSGYYPIIKDGDLNRLIDFIVNWYEIKYPDKDLQENEGILNYDNVENISNHLTFNQFMHRLPVTLFRLINCEYRAHGGYINIVKDSNGKEEAINNICICIKHTNMATNSNLADYTIIDALATNGIVKQESLAVLNITNNKKICLDELLNILDTTNRDDIDYSEIQESVEIHNLETKLRRYVLELAALKLVYSENTVRARGYKRAEAFIEEFNNNISNLNLYSIDEIINSVISKSSLPDMNVYDIKYENTQLLRKFIKIKQECLQNSNLLGIPYEDFANLDEYSQFILIGRIIKNNKSNPKSHINKPRTVILDDTVLDNSIKIKTKTIPSMTNQAYQNDIPTINQAINKYEQDTTYRKK